MQIFKKKHNNNLYNTLLNLSRNIFFYKKILLPDTFETRVYLMFFHFSIIMIVFKLKGTKFDQKSYDSVFDNIENNIRELGFGDVTVNKKMKELNKILYDILLKIKSNNNDDKKMLINKKLIIKYFPSTENMKKEVFIEFEQYFSRFNDFCFELSLDNMIEEVKNFN
tara:strand:+ start:132 stop:632 length:501 start_codon:yes stop_codon:yes gene_type:complete